MPKRDYDRYSLFRSDGSIDQLPFIKIPESSFDKWEEWKVGISRLDIWSERYYNNPFYDFLILYANPEYLDQNDIPDGTIIRIPFPLSEAIRLYENGLKRIKNE